MASGANSIQLGDRGGRETASSSSHFDGKGGGKGGKGLDEDYLMSRIKHRRDQKFERRWMYARSPTPVRGAEKPGNKQQDKTKAFANPIVVNRSNISALRSLSYATALSPLSRSPSV